MGNGPVTRSLNVFWQLIGQYFLVVISTGFGEVLSMVQTERVVDVSLDLLLLQLPRRTTSLYYVEVLICPWKGRPPRRLENLQNVYIRKVDL